MATRILVVDDNQDIRNLLATWLNQAGYQVVLANDGHEALEAFDRAKPQLVLLDMLLPKKNGIEICKQIKSSPESSTIPVVMMTAVYKGMQFAIEAKKSGANQYIEKPFQHDKILALVDDLIGPPEIQMMDEISYSEKTISSSEIALEGDLSNTSLPSLLHSIHGKKLKGELRLKDGTAIKSIFFIEGDPIYTSSNQISDRLGITVLKRGLITKEEYDDAVRYMQQSAGSMKIGQALILKGYINEFELSNTLREQYKQIMLSVFGWEKGEYTFVNRPEIKRQRDALEQPLHEIIMEGIYRHYSFSRIKTDLKTLDVVFGLSAEGKKFREREGIDRTLRELFDLIDGSRSLKDIQSLAPEKGEENIIKLYSMYMCGWLGIKEVKEQEEEENNSYHVITPEMIEQKHKAIQEQNYYQLLGIDPKSDTKQIKKAYFKLAKLYHPDKFLGQEFTPYKENIDEIFNKISHAYRVLTSVSKRREYEKTMSTPRQDRETVQKYTKVRNAEMRFIEGKAAFQRAKYDEAIEAIRWAIDLNPDESEYHRYMGMAYMRKYTPENEEFKDSEHYLTKAVELRQKDPEAYFWLGQYYKQLDEDAKALENFKKAIELKPNYHEAMREIRLYQMRQEKPKKKGGLFRKN